MMRRTITAAACLTVMAAAFPAAGQATIYLLGSPVPVVKNSLDTVVATALYTPFSECFNQPPANGTVSVCQQLPYNGAYPAGQAALVQSGATGASIGLRNCDVYSGCTIALIVNGSEVLAQHPG